MDNKISLCTAVRIRIKVRLSEFMVTDTVVKFMVNEAKIKVT